MSATLLKTFPVVAGGRMVDGADAGEEGEFSAVVATYEVDRIGDRIVPGAFAKTLAAWRESGRRIPVSFAHDMSRPSLIVGSADPADLREVAGVGLVAKGRLDLSNPEGMRLRALLMEQVIGDWSFAFKVPPGGERKTAGGVTELREIVLVEFGPCPSGIGLNTRTLSVKSADVGGELGSWSRGCARCRRPASGRGVCVSA